jgi:tetraacyldisaccharide 4'-kinase
VDVIVADDGLQHYRLDRDLEIVVLDADRGLGNEQLLPAGPLREPRNRLASADLLLINGNPAPDDGYGFELIPGELVNLGGDLRRPLADWKGQHVWSVAGIGNPDRFHRLLRDAGLLVEAPVVADHGRLGLAALRAQAPWPILMTEKDAVKYPQAPADCWYLPVNPRFTPNALAAVDARLDGLRRARLQ